MATARREKGRYSEEKGVLARHSPSISYSNYRPRWRSASGHGFGLTGLAMQSRRIDEYDLCVIHIVYRKNAVTRRLRFRGDNADLAPDDGINQRRFADIGPTDYGND